MLRKDAMTQLDAMDNRWFLVGSSNWTVIDD